MPLVYSRLAAISAASPAKVASLLAAAAHRVEARAKLLAPVDTGHLRASIAATGAGLSWQVSAAAAYSAYVELGTRRMPARPYLVPALRQELPGLLTALGAVV